MFKIITSSSVNQYETVKEVSVNLAVAEFYRQLTLLETSYPHMDRIAKEENWDKRYSPKESDVLTVELLELDEDGNPEPLKSWEGITPELQARLKKDGFSEGEWIMSPQFFAPNY